MSKQQPQPVTIENAFMLGAGLAFGAAVAGVVVGVAAAAVLAVLGVGIPALLG